MPALTEATIDTACGRFTVRVAGDESALLVLCLHGFPDTASTFDDLLDRLAGAGFRGVAPYCRGYAPSPLTLPAGEKLFDMLATDTFAIAEALAPGRPFAIVGHDNGAFATYAVLARAQERAIAAVTMTAAHPAAVFKNTSTSPRQIWRSRYALLFQLPWLSERLAARGDFAYLERLWHRWSAPGWRPPPEHMAAVKRTMRASWPAPLLHYRSMPFKGDETRLTTPTLYLIGTADGCVLPEMGQGQERFFAGPFRSQSIAGAGHFLHLEQPDVVGAEIVAWLRQQRSPPVSQA